MKETIEEMHNVKLRSLNKFELEMVQKALEIATKATRMYCPNISLPIMCELYITTKNIGSIRAMTYYDEFRTIVLTPKVFRGTYIEMLTTITHEFIHLVSWNNNIIGMDKIVEGFTDLATREILGEAFKNGYIEKKSKGSKAYDDYTNDVVKKIHEASMDVKTAVTAYLNPKENERFINDVFPI